MVLHQTWVSRRFLTILTKFDPKSILSEPKNHNFDLVVRLGWNQHHCKDYQILIPTTVHRSKSKLERPRYHKNRDDAPTDAPLTSESHNFWTDRWIFKFHTFSETESQKLAKGIKINLIKGGWRPLKGRQPPYKGCCLEVRAEAINSPMWCLLRFPYIGLT